MKLIFDEFPADLFNLIMHGEFYRATEKDYTRLMRIFNSCVIVKQEPKPEATPYNPSGDAISREALKEDFKSRLAACNKWIEKAKDKETKIRASAVKTFIGEVIMTINNAQTVEAYPFEQVQELVKLNQQFAKEIENLKRPQGEWVKEPNGKTTDIYRCSICGRSILLCKDADLSKYPFCHCGADMRTEDK